MSIYQGNNLLAGTPDITGKANISLNNLDSTGQAVIDGKVDLDLNNMNPSATSKATITGWGIPDYSSAIANISFPYTAPSAGMVKFAFIAGGDAWAKVNNISPAGRIGSKVSGNWIIQDLFVSTGDIVSIGGGNVTKSECCFIPLKGVVNA